jgi:PAS domain S-box-containing protein
LNLPGGRRILKREFIGGEFLRIPGSLADDATAAALHQLLIALLAWTVFYGAIILPFVTPTPLGSGIVLGGQVAAFATALFHLRRGRVWLASLIYLSGLWVTATVVIVLNGGIRSTGLVWYVAIPMSAAWLLGSRGAVVSGVLCVGTSLGLAVLGASGVRLPVYFTAAPVGIWAGALEATIAGSVPVLVVLRTLSGLLETAQRSITDMREAREALRREHDLVTRMMETSPIGILAFNTEGRIEFANANAEDILGLTRDELRRRQYNDPAWRICDCGGRPYPEDDLPFRKVRSTLKPVRDVRHAVEDRRGNRTLLSVNAAPLLSAAGEFEGIVAAIEDITERQRNQERLITAQKMESLVALIAGIAHKFNNDIGTILSEADLALSELTPGSEAHQSLQRLCAVAIRLSKTVSLLRIYDARYQSTNLVPVNLSQLVEESVSLFKVSLSWRPTLVLDITHGLPAILADASEIRQIVVSLLSNAWESLANGGGSISVSTSLVSIGVGDNGEPSPGLADGAYIRLEVKDTGCGILPENLPKIFDPFYTTKSLGRGLGLAAVQGIVRRVGGSIQAESTPGQGSTFEILFPPAK